jgi:hypothetical protein
MLNLAVPKETAKFEKLNNTHPLDTLHNHFHFIKPQSLDMFRPSLAHPQEELHEHKFAWGTVPL